MRIRLRSALVPSIGLSLACASVLLVDSSAGYTPCPVASNACGGERIEAILNGGFKPTKLPKKRPAPAHFSIEGTIRMTDGSSPPPLQELVLEIDRNAAFDAKGLPACRPGSPEFAPAPEPCRAATRVGKGEMEFEIDFSESAPIVRKSHAVAYNGGKRDGVTTIYVPAFIPYPVSAAVVMTVKISKIHNGRYGTKLVATIPPIAGGYGSVKKFQLELFRLFAYKHRRQSFVSARCADGKLQAKAELIFGEGLPTVGLFKRPCIARG